MKVPASLALALLFLLAQFGIAFGANGSINATVLVQCPFALKLNMHPVYVRLPGQGANFSIYTTVNCPIPSMSGNFYILSSNNTILYSLPINASAGMVPKLYNFSFNPSNIVAGTYNAKLSFTYYNFTNYSYGTFMLGNPTNISIVNFSTSNTITRFSSQYFRISLKNTGSFAVANGIAIRILTTGPYTSSLVLPMKYSLSPSQFLNLTVAMYNSTLFPGTYNALLNVTYPINGTGSKFYRSVYKMINYTVVPPPPSPPKPMPVPVSPTPEFYLSSFPFLISLISGGSSTSVIDIKSNSNVTEYFNITIPFEYRQFAQLSAASIAIAPHQSIGITALFMAPKIAQPGQYVIPINITAHIANSIAQETLYTTLSIMNSTVPSALPSISLTNNTHAAIGSVIISNPTGSNLTNIDVKTMLPLSITPNMSMIKPYGLPYSISMSNNSYVTTWYVSSLPRYSSAYAYFSISNITSQMLLTHLETIFAVPSVPTPSSILKIIDIETPSPYVNETALLKVTAFYTGTAGQRISIYVLAPPGVTVYNSSQYINATPNMAFTKTFPIISSNVGTVMLSLYISTQGANMSYSIPMLVLAKPIATTIPTTTIPPPPARISNKALVQYGIFGVSILIFAIVIIAAAKSQKKPKYNPERAEKLKEIREIMKRSEQ